MEIISLLLGIVGLILVWQNSIMSFKIGYYEQLLEDNKDKFTESRQEQIQSIKSKNSLFGLMK